MRLYNRVLSVSESKLLSYLFDLTKDENVCEVRRDEKNDLLDRRIQAHIHRRRVTLSDECQLASVIGNTLTKGPLDFRSGLPRIMKSIVMPGGKESEISYRVKCVVVESERVFGDILITQKTRNRRYWVNTCHYPDVSGQKFCNLTKQVLDTPDFMALNRKPNNRRRNVEGTAIISSKNNYVANDNSRDNGAADEHMDLKKKQKSYPLPILRESVSQEVVVSSLVDQLLLDIYGYPRSERGRSESDSTASSYKLPPQHRYLQRARLLRKSKEELSVVLETLSAHVNHAGGLLVRQLRRRDYLVAKRDKHYDVITAHLQAYSAKRSEDTRMRFSLTPQPGESGFVQWLDAMKMVARLQGGIPQEFRKRLWLTLAERHLEQRGVDWKQAEKLCFNEWSNPDDEELGIQIVKDLHRTGCSLFCGAAGRDNQAVLRRVLLGFARWNKSVGYCQGLNVLAALVLQVTDRAESSAVKVMIYLIEGVLPEGYFADNLRGLSIDMAVFRDLLRMRLPKLSRHLEALQSDAKDKATGSSYEPPLTNVFTMQWFLTLFCHCLPQEAVLRVWDLIFLEGDEVLLRTALAIWEGISDRIMTVTSADEFYSIMGVLTREMLEFTDVNNLIKTIVNMGPLYGVTDLREKHRYNITPWARRLSDEEDTDTEDEERLAVAAAMFGVSQRFKKDRSNASSSALQTIGPASERERIALDITTLKQQYAKLRERQRQAHIILSAACARQSMVPSTSQAMNHLLVGKSALVSAKTRQLGPPPGAIPPKPRTAALHSPRVQGRRDKQGVTLHWKDTKKPRDTRDEMPVGDDTETITTSVVSTNEGMSITLTSPKRSTATDSDSDSTSTELCDEPDRLSDVDSEEPTSTSDCYIMATDDEKSPRPGASPIVGNTSIGQTSERQASKTDSTTRVQSSSDSEAINDEQRRELLDVKESSSIAMIIDQIRRLSSSDDVNESSIRRDDEKKEAQNEDNNPTVSQKDNFREDDNSIADKLLIKISPVHNKTDDTAETSFNASAQSFEKLDSYDFLSSRSNEKLDAAVSDSAGIMKTVSILRDEKMESSGDFLRNPINSESVYSSTIEESLGNKEIGTIRKYQIETTKSCEDYKVNGLKSNGTVVADSCQYGDAASNVVASNGDQSETITGERTFYSRSYVIGYLPIAPTTVNKKLDKGVVEISPLKENVDIFGKEIDKFEMEAVRNTSFDSVFGDEKLGKADERIYSRKVGSFDSEHGKKINNSFESDSLKTLSKDSFASFDKDIETKINTSFESVSSNEKVITGGEFSSTKDDAKSFNLGNFDGEVRTKINTSFESVSGNKNDRKITEFSSIIKSDEKILPKDTTSFDSDVKTIIDVNLESITRSDEAKKVPDFSPISDNARFYSRDIGSFESEVSTGTTSNFHAVSTIGEPSKIVTLSPTNDIKFFEKDSGNIVADIEKNFDSVFNTMRNQSIDISPVNKTADDLSVLTETDFSSKKIENLRFDIHKPKETDGTPNATKSRENKIIDLSPLNDNFRFSSKDIQMSGTDIEKSNTTFDPVKNILSETMITDSFSSFTVTEASNKLSKIGYEMHKSLESSINSSEPISLDTKVTDASSLSKSLKRANNDPDTQNYSVEKKLSTNPEPEIAFGSKIDESPTTRLSISLLTDRKKTIDDRRIDENLSLIGIGAGRLSSDYNYRDSLMRTHEEAKKSPKTPESAKSFSSGETMGPDSKTSSLATSPRTPNRVDSRNFTIDKSARSSVSSDTKTLTLRSMDSETGGTRTKLDRKSEVARTSLDKSSPSTPLSTDSLKNKSDISPKFIISSSSESCSPGKAKSSDRSFSSELQSPISANSIKYRTNYTENQDNLSETSMDICSATSPFYPIVYPNQKTPSPYGATGKQRSNADSTETSPEQKSISSKEGTPSVTRVENEATKNFKSNESARSSKDRNDDYDSARPFEKELAETLSALPSESIARTKNERISSIVKDSVDLGGYIKKKSVEIFLKEENSERYMETDTVSPLPGDKFENRSAFADKCKGSFKNFSVNERDQKYLSTTRDSFKPFERSSSSLEKRFAEIKSSSSTEEFGTNTHKKRSSDILEDLRHLESKTTTDGKADTSMLTRKTGYDWEDLKNLEARRQDNFSDSASEFSRDRLDVPSINVFGDSRKSYVVEPKINLEECSILKSYARKKSNGEPDDDRESKLGVWTKVKPRAIRPNGRRSSDRALKIIQENSAILHKILTCQAKKRLPDLEEISKEITISPINEEISKIFSPILEKMGLNEHEINEELARINFKDFDQMTGTSGSEFDAKMNDELCKLSLIDDNEIVDHLDVDDVISRDYLDTREALIDRQINEELSKLLANYEESPPICVANRDEASSCQNPSELEGLELSSISNNVFSYQSSNDSIETKSELGSIQETGMQSDIFSQYTGNVMSNFAQQPKYPIRGLSPRSDIDIYQELEKLDKISSGEIFPSAPSSATQKIISPISYAADLPSYAEIRPSSLEYCAKPEKSFDPSPMKSPYDTYKPYDFKSRISPRKTPSNPYSARAYEKSTIDKNFEFHDDHSTTPSRLYDLGSSRPILSKETLEFRVRYDDDTATKIRDDDLSLEPYQTNLVDLERGASYYTAETPITLKRLTNDTDRSHNTSLVSPLDYPYNPSNLYSHKYEQISPKNYSYPSPTTSGYDKKSYNLDEPSETASYLSMRRKNSQSLSPNYQYADRDFAASLNPYSGELATSLDDDSKRPVSHPEFAEKMCVPKYPEVSSRDSLSFRKASLSLGPLDGTTSRNPTGIDTTPSPRSLFSPFPVRNSTRKRKELGLKLGLYSPSSPGSTSLKRS